MNPKNIDNLFPGEINTEHFIGGAIKSAFKTIVGPLIEPILTIPRVIVDQFVGKFIGPLITMFFGQITPFIMLIFTKFLDKLIVVVKFLFNFVLLIIVFIFNLPIGEQTFHKYVKKHEYDKEYQEYKVTKNNKSSDYIFHSDIDLKEKYKVKHAVCHVVVLWCLFVFRLHKYLYNFLMWCVAVIMLKCDKKMDGAIASFAYKYIYACENDSNDWFQTVGYHYDNKNARKFFYNVKKCSKGYIPDDSGLHCVRINSFEPLICPQANIYRIHKNDDTYKTLYPLLPREFDTVKSPNYNGKTEFEKKKEEYDYNDNKTIYYKTCAKKMSDYDMISENICRNFDYENTKSKNKSDDLEKLCVDTYCTHGRYETFCGKFKTVERKINRHDTDLQDKQIRKFYYSLTLLTLLSASSIIIFTKSGAVNKFLQNIRK